MKTLFELCEPRDDAKTGGIRRLGGFVQAFESDNSSGAPFN